VAVTLEPVSEGGLARAGAAEKGHRVAANLDAIGVEGQQSALVEQSPEGRTEQKHAQLAFAGARGWIDDDAVAAADQEAADLGNLERQGAIVGDAAIAVLRRYWPVADDDPSRVSVGTWQAGERQIRVDGEPEQGARQRGRQAPVSLEKVATQANCAAFSPPISTSPPTLSQTWALSAPPSSAPMP
jgi:hypothetical protein